MAGEFLLATQFLTAAAMLALAAWLLYLKFSSPVHRSFALFLLLRAIVVGINGLRALLDHPPGTDELLFHLREYALLASVPVLVYFALQYMRPAVVGWGWKWTLRAVLSLQLILPLLYAIDHSLANHCPVTCIEEGGEAAGPLAPIAFALPLTSALVALVLAQAARRGNVAARRRSTLLLSGALVVNGLIQPSIALGLLQVMGWSDLLWGHAPSVWAHAAHAVVLLAIPASLVALGMLHRAAGDDAVAVSLASRVTALAAVTALVGLGVGGSSILGIASNWALFLTGLLGLLVPFLIVYALVRHRLFGLDVKVRVTITYSTIAGVFFAVFWVVSTVAQEFLADLYGWAIGGTAAGLLLFLLSPLQRFGERISKAAMPHTRPLHRMTHKERARLFRDQAELVWSDGLMGVRERRILDQLRQRLQIPAEEAAKIESEAAQAHAPRRPESRGHGNILVGGSN